MSKVLIDRSVVEQALDALQDAETIAEHHQDVELRRSAMEALRAALEQPQVEQEPVAWIEHEWSGSGLRHLHFERPAPTVRDEVVRPVWTPLYTHPQNLNCKSTQHRLATLWGYVKPQPPRQPLTQEQIEVIEAEIWNLGSMDTIERESNTQFARAIERAHGIGGEE